MGIRRPLASLAFQWYPFPTSYGPAEITPMGVSGTEHLKHNLGENKAVRHLELRTKQAFSATDLRNVGRLLKDNKVLESLTLKADDHLSTVDCRVIEKFAAGLKAASKLEHLDMHVQFPDDVAKHHVIRSFLWKDGKADRACHKLLHLRLDGTLGLATYITALREIDKRAQHHFFGMSLKDQLDITRPAHLPKSLFHLNSGPDVLAKHLRDACKLRHEAEFPDCVYCS
ncbi:uncharacterized protein EV422DRAFT_608961 [Fimicolochytrium jonesii]|uniref:uncharacterized protein n=1 Tax=Fimicolochytrium jonesii TaxID=1396493 RepID=UPI0022FEBB99|nr:uncharacterized protein EV422DRAFT_608961 [Fimicolochytrium jonesii]KAI8824043.1 hypothetical protein EV422DRAFT_608961 [Fimicolochytrium jonesii]